MNLSPDSKVVKEIERIILVEEKRASFLLDFIIGKDKKGLAFMNSYFDRSIKSIESGISVLSEKNKLNKEDNKVYLEKLNRALEKAKSGKDFINS